MARVSQQHLDARRRQILEGAARCFSRNGFHATSMQDVLREVDLSAGAVYRYFSGKDELIGAVVDEVLGIVRGIFEAAVEEQPVPLPDVVVGRAMREVFALPLGTDMPRLMVQAWSETMRDPELTRRFRDGFAQVQGAWERLVTEYQRCGLMRPDVRPEHVARVMIALAQGFAAQRVLVGDAGPGVVEEGLRGLMSMGERPATTGVQAGIEPPGPGAAQVDASGNNS